MSAEELLERAISLAARGDDREARRLTERALDSSPSPDLRARILVHEAYHRARTDSVGAALALLDEVEATSGLRPSVLGRAAVNRGLVLFQSGTTGALAAFDRALRVLPPVEFDARFVAHLNRGAVHLEARRLTAARRDFRSALSLAQRGHDEPGIAMSSANLAYVLMLGDDLPGALRELDAVAPVLSRLSPVLGAKCVVNRAEVLLAAGLLDEAVEDLRGAARTFGAHGDVFEQAEAEHLLGRVHLALGEAGEALRLATSAGDRFASRGAAVRAARSRCLSLQAELARRGETPRPGDAATAATLPDVPPRTPQQVATAAQALADTFAAHHLTHDERSARLLVAEALLEAGEVERARSGAGDALRRHRGEASVDRLRVHRLRARLALAEGHDEIADAELRSAFRHLRRRVGLLGSLELRTAMAVHAQQMAQAAVERALERDRPGDVLTVAEATRGLSARPSPVTRRRDPQAAAWLEELRQIRTAVTRSETAADPRDTERAHELEKLLRERAWHSEGRGDPEAGQAEVPQIQAAVGEQGGALLTLLAVRARLVAVVLRADGVSTHPLGPLPEAVAAARAVRADLDVLAGARLPAPMAAVVRASLQHGLDRLGRLLLPGPALAGDGPLLLSPSAALALVPWGLLPPLRGRTVTVSPTATSWLRGRARTRPVSSEALVGVVLGPGLEHGRREVRAVGEVWPGAEVVEAATSADALRLVGRCDVFHASAHGVHEPQSPLFSHLVMADGPLFGHELHGLARVPGHVVLSACELGCAETRPGDERLGMTAALLAAGVGSVVAGVARVDDQVSARVAAAHHRGLAAGLVPAQALAAALAAEPDEAPPAPFVCFGSGW
ncbi:CHAT domain-containing protein [Jannaschia sp. R86511]|uniref:CHAT domain-containing protein n=1 Tax=Jannaschia sp. R86511 TaxID=3093853 RepID=UPI0036D29059